MTYVDTDQEEEESSFTGVKISQEILQMKCDKFSKDLQQKEKSWIRQKLSFRNATERKVAQLIVNGGELTPNRVTDLVGQLQIEWKESHSKATRNFLKICCKLDSHKEIFKCFPSETAYTSTLCGAVSIIIQASVAYEEIAEQLSCYVTELSERIAVCTDWLSIFDKPTMQIQLSAIYEEYFDFFIAVATWYLQPKASKWIDAFNNNIRKRFTSSVENIKQSIELIRNQGEMMTAQTVQHINGATAIIEEKIDELVEEKKATMKEDEIRRALFWLAPKHPEIEIHSDRVEKRQKGTNLAFLKSFQFIDWFHSSEKAFLWIKGIPGAGKSIQASTIIDEINSYTRTSVENIASAFFYCTFTNTETITLSAVISGLVSQLCSRSSVMAQKLIDHRRAKMGSNVEDQLVRPDTQTLIDIIRKGFINLDKIVLIIDGLDECSNTEMIARELYRMYAETEGQLKIVVSSRVDPAIERSFQGVRQVWLTDFTLEDVKIFVDGGVSAMRRDQNISDGLLKKVHSTIIDNAKDMFLLASHQMKLVKECDCDEDVDEALKKLPRDIDECYVQILNHLSQIVKDNDSRARRQRLMLRWLVVAKRPLQLEELAEAVSITPGENKLNRKGLVKDPSALIRICTPLIHVNEATREVTLCHYSAKEFLTRDKALDGHDHLMTYHVDEQSAHEEITQCCLTYLLFDSFSEPIDDMDDLTRRKRAYRLLEYATFFVGEHCAELSSCSDAVTSYLDRLFFPELVLSSISDADPKLAHKVERLIGLATVTISCPSVGDEYHGIDTDEIYQFRRWIARDEAFPAHLHAKYNSDDDCDDPTQLFKKCLQYQLLELSSRPNCRSWLQLYRILASSKRKDHHGNISPLYFCALFNWQAGVQKYLELHQDRVTTSELNHALRGAAIGGSTLDEHKNRCACIIKILVKEGAEVNSNVEDIGSALQSAAYCANIEAVDELIAHNAQINENSTFYRPGGTAGSALDGAAVAGNQELIERLIDHGADVNRGTAWAGMALDLSLRHLNPDLTRFFLSHGADPSIYYGYNISSIHNMCSLSESTLGLEIMMMLLEAKPSGVDLNPYPYGTPLQKACFFGQKKTVDLLLARNADITASSGQFGDALQSASMHQNDMIVTSLLDHGANPDSDAKLLRDRTSVKFEFPFYGGITILQGGKGLEEFWWSDPATECQNLNNPFPKYGFYAPAMQAALRWRDDAWNRVLLLFNEEPMHQEGHYGSPIQAAALFGAIDNVSALLNHPISRADPNSCGGIFGTALQAASFKGHIEIIQLLIEHGAQVDIHGGLYGSALLAAAASGNDKAFQYLMDAGADPHQVDVHNWSCTDWKMHIAGPRIDASHFSQALLPTKWGSGSSKSPQLELDETYTEVMFQGRPCCSSNLYKLLMERADLMRYAIIYKDSVAASVISNHPFPSARSYYFEFTIVSVGIQGLVSIGVSDGRMPRFELPGRFPRSWGYHASTGKCFGEREELEVYESFSTGDTVGCGFDWEGGCLYFTKNGQRHRPEISIPTGLQLFPTVGMCSENARGRVNFGDRFMYSWGAPNPIL